MTPVFGFVGMFLGWTMSLLSIFLILLVLVQRGRGGGLTGALGGPGGQSAFGSKAGDMFTKITSVVALVWIGLCAVATASLGEPQLTEDDLDEDVPGLISREPEDATTLSFPSPTDTDLGEPGLGALETDDADAAGDADDVTLTPAASDDAAGDDAAGDDAAEADEAPESETSEP
ncbi:preprotein translocase subunit SecG [Roseimaritima sediminicola]|uniref:preprotein translocase subunit SecG n=1 Tax=Roseimaritima sediminicola TaxID=2662066 RepID=UPI00129826EC|nr:preprotein translocase subunit SecG [Roseimaritima sediminicola]